MGPCCERSKHNRTSETAETTYSYMKDRYKSYVDNYKEAKAEAAEAELNSGKDESDTQIITFYEENNLNLRHVLLDEYETRLKKFVYLKPLVKLK